MQLRDNIKDLQSIVGAYDDGYWGNKSQTALLESGKKIDYKAGKLAKHFGPLDQDQVNGFDAIRDACNEYGRNAINPLYFSYMLATTWHETGIIIRRNGRRIVYHTMKPVEEMGRGRGRRYGRRIDIDGSRYSSSLPIYYGRGYVQLTWLSNYVLMRKLLDVDFVNKPQLALDPKHAADIMITGMLGGFFTGKALSDCIEYGSFDEFKEARRVINGTDQNNLIADYAVKFLDCITFV